MDTQLEFRRGETAAHLRLKRLALLWAQANGYTACAVEVRLPRSRFRADVAAYGCDGNGERTAIFECKQSSADLRRDNVCAADRTRLRTVLHRREIIERNLRVHFPALRRGEALFPEYDSYDFEALNHAAHARVMRELNALHKRVSDCTKFETMARYRCANQLFVVVAGNLANSYVAPEGWGVLVERGDRLELQARGEWIDNHASTRAQFLRQLASAATRAVNRQLKITAAELDCSRAAAQLAGLSS